MQTWSAHLSSSSKYAITQETPQLNADERNLFSASYKNFIGGKRSAFRALTAILQKDKKKEDLLTPYKDKIEAEVESICNDANDVIDKILLPKAEKEDAKVFYLKMKGDYYRYFSECTSGDKLKAAGDKADAAYKEALKLAECLKTTDAVRLGLALNYSVFYYEVRNSPEEACKLAKTAFDSAVSQLESLPDEEYKDSASILQLIRDNLTLWQGEKNEEPAEEVQNL